MIWLESVVLRCGVCGPNAITIVRLDVEENQLVVASVNSLELPANGIRVGCAMAGAKESA
jgi:hypothetical protein